jgi:hypothetical protein
MEEIITIRGGRASHRISRVAGSPCYHSSASHGNRSSCRLASSFLGSSSLLPDSLYVLKDILAFLTQAFAFYLYVAYAEEVSIEVQQTGANPLRGRSANYSSQLVVAS